MAVLHSFIYYLSQLLVLSAVAFGGIWFGKYLRDKRKQ